MLAFAAFVVSLGLLFVAFSNWRTAHRKLLLDLFEKRYALYEEVLNAIGPVMRDARATEETVFIFNRIKTKAQFLFGPEVEAYLESLRLSAIHTAVFRPTDMEPGEEKLKAIAAHYKHLTNLSETYDRLAALVEPYMKLDVRLDDDPTLRLDRFLNDARKRVPKNRSGN